MFILFNSVHTGEKYNPVESEEDIIPSFQIHKYTYTSIPLRHSNLVIWTQKERITVTVPDISVFAIKAASTERTETNGRMKAAQGKRNWA